MSFIQKICIIWGLFWGTLAITFFFLGLFGLYYPFILIVTAILFFALLISILIRIKISQDFFSFVKKLPSILKKDKALIILSLIFVFSLSFNFLMLLVPEIGFDALWYHLTIPKIYLLTHHVGFLGRDLLYYSMMPRLAEMIYGFGLAITPSAIIPRLIHYLFGVFWVFATYSVLRLYLSRRVSFLAALITYSTLPVTILSGTAYIDLFAAFYAAISFYGLFSFIKTKDKKKLILAAIFLGLYLATKLYALFLLAIFLLVLLFFAKIKTVLKFASISILMVLTFYLQAFLITGNPIYPLFSVPDSGLWIFLSGNPTMGSWIIHSWWKDLPKLLVRVLVKDFTPILVLVILTPIFVKWKKIALFILIFIAFFTFWSLLPMHEPRYFLIILPILSLLLGFLIESPRFKWSFWPIILAVLIILGFNIKTEIEPIRVALGHESKEVYLSNYLPLQYNYLPINNGNISKIVQKNKVLTANIHNLFYIDFSFVDWSMLESKLGNKSSDEVYQALKNEKIDYLLVSHSGSPPWKKFPQSLLKDHADLLLDQNNLMLYKLK